MHDLLMQITPLLVAATVADVVKGIWPYVLIFLGFSAVIFVHELGHFLVAKWAGVRVDKFCIGFGREIFGFTRGETRYGFNILPLGGYVKMLGQEDFEVDTTGELQAKEDPRSFANKPVSSRMAIVSAGVVMNVLFAAFLFMIVFMVGMKVGVTEVGYVKPNSPADLGGLKVGDTVLHIDGKKINEFNEINMAIMLADPHVPLDFEVERSGQLKHLKLLPENNEERNVLMVGMGPAVTREIVTSPPGADPDRKDLPRPGDKIVEIDGQPVTDDNANDMYFALVNDPGKTPTVIVERPEDPDLPDSPTKRVQVEVLPSLRLYPSDPTSQDLINVLGLAPLMRFDFVETGGRAEKAGIKVGDIVTRIGDIDYPTWTQIVRTIRNACTEKTGDAPEDFEYVENDIPIVLSRPDEPVPIETTLRPHVRAHMFKRNSYPDIGGSYDLIANDVMRIGKIVPEIDGVPTPAAEADIPAGAVLASINGAPLKTWTDLVERLRENAGSSVTLAYTTADGEARTAEMNVPHSLRTKLGLPVVSRIVSVDGDETVEVELKGKERPVSVSNWFGLKTRLARSVGETVRVKYVVGYLGQTQEAEVQVTADMIDPWVGRIEYRPNIMTLQAQKLFRTSNPVEAIGIGINKTTYFILNVYTTIKRMVFTRSVGVEHLSGPVGIVKVGSDIASLGFNQLLFFLAIISANLAVINFLPMPIVDGGLMVFLIIEKIKGTPVSIKTQVVTQVIGLVLIIAAFLFVTIQDLQRLFG